MQKSVGWYCKVEVLDKELPCDILWRKHEEGDIEVWQRSVPKGENGRGRWKL